MQFSLIALSLLAATSLSLGADFTADAEGNVTLIGGTITVNDHAKANICQIGPREDEGKPVAERTPTELVLGPEALMARDDGQLEALKIYPGSSLVLQGGSIPDAGRVALLGSIRGEGTVGLRQLEMFPESSLALTSGTFFWGGMEVLKGLNPTLRIGGELAIGPKVKFLFDGNLYAQILIEPTGTLRGALTWLFPTKFTMAGTVIADGSGTDQDLDLRKLVLAPADGMSGDKKASGTGGWKAVNRGRLLLPIALPEADGSAQPGQPGGKRPTLIGVARVIDANEPVETAILATDRDELKDSPVTAIGAWQLIGAKGSAVELRYDNASLQTLSADPAKLVAFVKTDAGWQDITDQAFATEMSVLTKPLPADGLVVVGLPK